MTKPAIDFQARMQQATGVDVEAVLQDFRDSVEKVAEAGKEIARIKAEMAMLFARHGSGKASQSHFEYERKAKYSEVAEARRTELLRMDPEARKAAIGSDKVSEAYLESYAHANPAYLQFLEHARGEKRRLEELQAKLSLAFAKQEHAKGVQTYLAARLDVIKGQMYAYGAEARLG